MSEFDRGGPNEAQKHFEAPEDRSSGPETDNRHEREYKVAQEFLNRAIEQGVEGETLSMLLRLQNALPSLIAQQEARAKQAANDLRIAEKELTEIGKDRDKLFDELSASGQLEQFFAAVETGKKQRYNSLVEK